METAPASIVRRGFGGYTRHFWSASIPKKPYNELAWVNCRYTPADLRSTAPVQARKFLSTPRPASEVPSYWVPAPEAPLKSFSRAAEETALYSSSPATRTEVWSTLRQMLPSKGHYIRRKAARWGVSDELAPPLVVEEKPKRYPAINSLMTR